MTLRIFRLALVAGLIALLPAVSTAGAATPSPESASSDWRQLSAGYDYTCGIRTTGRLYCWGSNDTGQLGDGTMDPRDVPTQVSGGGTDWAVVSAGREHTCGLRRSGRLYCWGWNGAGQLGDGTNTQRTVPTQVAGGVTTWGAPSSGFTHTCALRTTGELYCWGANFSGQVGDGTTDIPRVRPRLVVGGFTNWTAVTTGYDYSCGLRQSGRLYCWGTGGALGNASPDERPRPTLVGGGFTDWRAVDAGAVHTCGLRASGRLYCWGGNERGQLGDDSTTPRALPREVAGHLTTWTSVTAGGVRVDAIGLRTGSSCARRSTGRLYCWGDNGGGTLGDGTFDQRHVPTAVAGGATDWRFVSLGTAHACATTTTNRAYCWGNQGEGMLGTGDGLSHNRPERVFTP